MNKEVDTKSSNIVKSILSSAFNTDPSLSKLIEQVSIAPYIIKDNMPKFMVVEMPLQLLINFKLQYTKIITALKKEFPKFIILTRRQADLTGIVGSTPVKAREEIIADLAFPSIVSARTNEVESRNEQTQVVYLDGKSNCWAKQDLLAMEKLYNIVFGLEFKIKIFGA